MGRNRFVCDAWERRIPLQKIYLLPLLLIGVFVLVACSPVAEPPAVSGADAGETAHKEVNIKREADVPRLSAKQAKAYFDDGTAIFMDSRSQDSYDVKHIAGALPRPMGTIEELKASVDQDQLVIAYCT